MSANINENSRVFTVGEAWHGLGTVVDTEQKACDAIRLAKLDYKVSKKPSGFQKDNGEWKVNPNEYNIVREDTETKLGNCTNVYKIVQNVEAFNFFDVVVGEGQAIYHSAGALGQGEKVWILAKLPNDIYINADDKVEKYLCLTNSYDGKSALRMYFTPIRVVCQNTLNMSLSDAKNGISIRHSGNINGKIDEARKVLGISINYYNQFEAITKQLEDKILTVNEVESYFDNVLGIDEEKTSTNKLNKKDDLLALFEGGKGQKLGHKHSAWKAYNAVTEYVDHHSTIKNVSKDTNKKIDNILFGTGAKMKEKAYNEALVLV